QAADVTDNSNVCWLDVLIEDKLPAYCLPPAAAAIDCDKLPYDFDPLNSEQMTKLFGTASGSDNCPGFTVTELTPVTDGLNDCGYGKLVRRFQVADGKGLTSTNKCEQIITVKEQHNYKIKFPKDASANCGIPQVDTVEVKELGCDLLAISVKDDKFTASGDECYKIFRTYRVINWCEYDGISDPVTVSRDEDCDGKPGDEDVWVIVKTVEKTDPCTDYYGQAPASYYSHVWYDRDSNPFNLKPEAGVKGKNCEYESNPYGFWKEVAPITENETKDTDSYPKGYYGNHCDDMASTGFWQYTQVIKVYDNVKPVISFPVMDAFCSYSSDLAKNCPAPVSINFTIDENCTPKDLTVKLILDAYKDGITDGDITHLLTGTYPHYTIKGDFPIGSHEIRVSVKDGCGNQAGLAIPFEVVDCKAPSPVCINGLAVELMPVVPAADVDGDGDKDKGATAVWASDFIASPSYDCTGSVTYSINRVGEAVKPDQTGLTLTCDDDASLLVEIWAWDGRGNGDFCETYVLVQDNGGNCSGGTGSVAGLIVTEEDNTLQNVSVEMSGGSFQTMKTKVDGYYHFSGLSSGYDYTITPQLDAQPMNGVSTFDLVLMSKHILGIKVLDSPYKMIAADVNNDKKISTLDVIALRKMILNIDSDFKNNTSWRFIPVKYVFPQPSNPWKEVFPEVINLNNVQGLMDDKDFIGVKIGDIDLNAKVNLLTAETRNARGLFHLQMTEQTFIPGEVYRIAVSSAQLDAVQGFQFTLQLDNRQLELVDIEYGIAQPGNLGLQAVADGLITASWNKMGENRTTGEAPLFTLVVRSLGDGQLSKIVSLSNRLTVAEAYDHEDGLMDVGIDFQAGQVLTTNFELLQNVPNPFRETTTIRFYLPEAAEGTLSVHDATGKTLKLVRSAFTQGQNELTLQRQELPASGVFYYKLTAGEHTATRKMILVD
ncbi:MAG: T9SS type A sorting domain-containing protein, partial [Lewinella sp.]|nr:T9SS type A sorting domain-containing protein [Lewinella sp.]